MSIAIEAVGNVLLRTKNNSIGVQAVEVIGTLQSLGWLSPDQLAIRDAETTRRALEKTKNICRALRFSYKHTDDGSLSKETYSHRDEAIENIEKSILALQPAPTGWKLVPDTALEPDKDKP